VEVKTPSLSGVPRPRGLRSTAEQPVRLFDQVIDFAQDIDQRALAVLARKQQRAMIKGKLELLCRRP
jgi:hypothetical protein